MQGRWLKVEGEEGESDGILLLDLTASAAGPSDPRPAPLPAAEVPAPSGATGADAASLPAAGVLVALGVLLAHVTGRSDGQITGEG